MKNLPKEKRKHLVLVAVLTVAAVATIYFLVIKSQTNSLRAVTEQIAEHKLKASNADRLVAQAPAAQKTLESSRQQLGTIEEGMASGDMYAWVIQTVGRFGAERKVDIPQFSREVATEVGLLPKFPYKAALFNLRGQAYFHDLGRFLSDFENHFPYARVQNLELEPATGSAANAGAGGTTDAEKLAFRLEIVTLVNPHAH
jgi:hypothetical protein